MEEGFYTSSQDTDRTSLDNHYILTPQVKYTEAVIEYVLDAFFGDGIKPGHTSLSLKEGAVGAVYITDDGVYPWNTEVLTDEIVAKVRSLADKIKSGEIDLSEVPKEGEYTF